MTIKFPLRTTAAIVGLASGVLSHAAVTGYSAHASFVAAAGSLAVETFESFAAGATLTALPSLGIVSISGTNYLSAPVAQKIGSSAALPFPMFSPPLPSGTKFMSNDMSSSAGFATGSTTFVFGVPTMAVGAFVADSSPLGGFNIEVFSGAISLGAISVGPRTLPASFVGIVSDTAFTSAKFYASSTSDSWGLDDLMVGAVPEPGTYALVLAGLALLGLSARRST